jgi:arabinogalactan oligomer/maltooligosaccharide transport system permease protein
MIARGFTDLQNFILLSAHNRFNAVIVYGVIAIVVVALFIFMYFISIKQTLKAATNYNERKLGSNFRKQLYELTDKHFYITSLVVPVIGAIVFTIIPLFFMIITAFTNYSNVTAPGYSTTKSVGFLEWVGFESFERIFANGANLQDLLSVFAWTMIWALLATFSCFFGGLLLAMLINKRSIKCKPLFRSIFVISMAMPQFVSLLVMRTFFDNYGPLQTFLVNLGWVSSDVGMNLWKTEFSARMLIIFINMWVGIPYYMLLMSGLLINIPKGYYEAAKISGASRWQQFKRITFPNIMFMTAPMLITSFVNNINNFNVIWFLTQGGPANDSISGTAGKTDILITWLYQLTMKRQDYNFGAAIGIIMFIITATLSLVVFHRSSSYKNEEEYQ